MTGDIGLNGSFNRQRKQQGELNFGEKCWTGKESNAYPDTAVYIELTIMIDFYGYILCFCDNQHNELRNKFGHL